MNNEGESTTPLDDGSKESAFQSGADFALRLAKFSSLSWVVTYLLIYPDLFFEII